MKTMYSVSLMILAASSAAAFTPVNSAKMTVQKSPVVGKSSNDFVPKTVMFQSDNTADDLQKQFEASTQFLAIDTEAIRNAIAKDWGWITASGAFSMILGVLAFALPLVATDVAYTSTTLTVGAAGLASLINVFFAQSGQHKFKSGLSGVGYLGLAYYMSLNPAAGLEAITLAIASAIALEGLYETVLAVRNKNIEGRGLHFVSGLGSLAVATGLGATFPASSLFLPGAALGARLTSSGATKVSVGLAGKKIADDKKKQQQ